MNFAFTRVMIVWIELSCLSNLHYSIRFDFSFKNVRFISYLIHLERERGFRLLLKFYLNEENIRNWKFDWYLTRTILIYSTIFLWKFFYETNLDSYKENFTYYFMVREAEKEKKKINDLHLKKTHANYCKLDDDLFCEFRLIDSNL